MPHEKAISVSQKGISMKQDSCSRKNEKKERYNIYSFSSSEFHFSVLANKPLLVNYKEAMMEWKIKEEKGSE